MLTKLDFNRLSASPWKNGSGITKEISIYPQGANLSNFIWRVSIAEINNDGPFSSFPDIDRTLVLLNGSGMLLTAPDMTQIDVVRPFVPHFFEGEIPFFSKLVDGPTSDLNIMVRRGKATSTLEVLHESIEGTLNGHSVFLCCMAGEAEVSMTDHSCYPLTRFHSIRVENARNLPYTLTIASTGIVFVISINLVST